MVTDAQTNTQTDSGDYDTLCRSLARSVNMTTTMTDTITSVLRHLSYAFPYSTTCPSPRTGRCPIALVKKGLV